MSMTWFKKGRTAYAQIKYHGQEMIFTQAEIIKARDRQLDIKRNNVSYTQINTSGIKIVFTQDEMIRAKKRKLGLKLNK